MRCSDVDLHTIVAQASTLAERLGPAWRPELAVAHDAVIDARLAEWCRVVARGDQARFRRRLALDGLSIDTARTALGPGRMDEAAALPGWAKTLRACLEFSAPCDSRCLDPHERLPFEEIALPFVGLAVQRVRAQVGSNYGLLGGRAQSALERQLLRRLTSLSDRSLYLEFSIFRASRQGPFERFIGRSSDVPSTRYYRSFVEQMLEGGLLLFFREYSVLARLMAMAVDQWVTNTVELLQRLEADWEEIGRLLSGDGVPVDLGQVVAVHTDLSDPHRQGRSVSALTFASGHRMIYKPRNIDLEQIYADLLEWCNTRGLPLDLKTLRMLGRPDYGWVEAVAHAPCEDLAAVRRYYQRAGMQLCLMYALEASDCHKDNLIACDEQPVLVDLEMLLTPRLSDPTYPNQMDHPVDQILGTVMHTLLLPIWYPDQADSILINGFGGTTVSEMRAIRTEWQATNTDAMFLQQQQAESTYAGDNMPRLHHTIAPPQAYQAEIVDGFQDMYRFLVGQRDVMLAEDGPLRKLAHQPIRMVIRHTEIYTRLLAYAQQPAYLRQGVERSIQLEVLNAGLLGADNQSGMWPLAQQEQRDLERLDVPHFMLRSSSDCLVPDQGRAVPHRFLAAGFTLLETRLRLFDECDLSRQTALIHAALGLSGPTAIDAPSPAVSGDPLDAVGQTALTDRAIAIAEELWQRAIPHRDGGIDWIDLAYSDKKGYYLPQSLNDDLYSGKSGVALFFAQLAYQTGDDRWRALAWASLPRLCYLQPHTALGDGSVTAITIGAGHGLGGMLYAFVRCSQLLDAPELAWRADELAAFLTPAQIAHDRCFDVLNGSAGAILGLLTVYAYTADAAVLERALVCGEHLLAAQIASPTGGRAWATMDGKLLTGFSHGAAGIAYALLRLYDVSRDRRFLAAAEEAMVYERSVFSAAERNWPDLRGQRTVFISTWCQGAAGIGLARLGGLAILDTAETRAEIAVALQRTCHAEERGEDHLCCGAFGRIETLLVAGHVLGRPDLLEAARRRVAALLDQARRYGWRLNTDMPFRTTNAGLFTGMAGIGYTLLRLAGTGTVPSVLLWE
jgi:type 2 lantibiotic biosynthesis protein LanM